MSILCHSFYISTFDRSISVRHKMETIKASWLLNVSEIELGHSAILGNNYFIFYAIHGIAMSLITASLFSCLAVIISISFRRQRSRRMEFADRFPLYLALADALWGISHFIDHTYLVHTSHFPASHAMSMALSINLWTFLGYQQLMHAALALYAYIRVVHGVEINLGTWEWKLHAFNAVLIGTSIAIFYPLDGFGPSGFWMLHPLTTGGGIALGFYVCITSGIQGLCTTLGYRGINKVIAKQRGVMQGHGQQHSQHSNKSMDTTVKCLGTFVFIGQCLYCPMGVVYFIFVIQAWVFGVIEPTTVLLVVILANSGGWSNAVGHFYNIHMKSKSKGDRLSKMATNSTRIISLSRSSNSEQTV